MDGIPEYKLILLGEPGVGKTNFFIRLRDGIFVGNTASTVSTGIEHVEYKIRINGSNIKAHLFDTAGGERFRTLTSNYYLNSDAAILMYSVEDSYSFQRLKDEVDNATKFINLDEFVWVLVGHKSDLDYEVSEDSVAAFAAQLDTKLNFIASSKTGENVVQLFDRVISHIHKVRRGRPVRHSSQSHQQDKVITIQKPMITKAKDNGASPNSDCNC